MPPVALRQPYLAFCMVDRANCGTVDDSAYLMASSNIVAGKRLRRSCLMRHDPCNQGCDDDDSYINNEREPSLSEREQRHANGLATASGENEDSCWLASEEFPKKVIVMSIALPRTVAGYAIPMCPHCDKAYGPEAVDAGPIHCAVCGQWFEVIARTVYQVKQNLDYASGKA